MPSPNLLSVLNTSSYMSVNAAVLLFELGASRILHQDAMNVSTQFHFSVDGSDDIHGVIWRDIKGGICSSLLHHL